MYKTKNTGTGNGVREPGESYILGTDAKHSVKYRQAFCKILQKIPENQNFDLLREILLVFLSSFFIATKQ